MRWVCKYATGRKECSFRPVMYAGMLRENLFVEPYDDGSGTKIEGQVLQFNHHAVKKCLSPCFAARGVPPIATDLSPHYSRRLLLQPPKRNQNLLRYSFFAPGSYKGRSTSQARWRRTWTAGGLAARSVNILFQVCFSPS